MQCPIDRAECDFGACDTVSGQCHKLNCRQDFSAEAIHIAEGIAWFGFWIAAGVIVATFIYKTI